MIDFKRRSELEIDVRFARERFEDAKDARYIYCADMLKFLAEENVPPDASVSEYLEKLDSRVDEAREELRLAIKRYNEGL